MRSAEIELLVLSPFGGTLMLQHQEVLLFCDACQHCPENFGTKDPRSESYNIINCLYISVHDLKQKMPSTPTCGIESAHAC